MSQEFRCIYCGDMFTLKGDDVELWEEGYLCEPPNCCYYCVSDDSSAIINDCYSDADPGL
jgi:hypothetical protein